MKLTKGVVSLKGEFLSNSTSVVWLPVYITTEKLKKKKRASMKYIEISLGTSFIRGIRLEHNLFDL